MRVELLGPGRVDGDVDALTPRDRVVLTALAIHRDRSVSVDAIAAALWGEAAPASRVKIVQGCISRLRKQLGQDAIATERDGYRLALDDDEVDIHRFAWLVARGRRLLAAQRPGPAADALGEALGLWSSRPLREVDDWDPGRSERQRLVELHTLAAELHVDALLRAGRPREALPEAARLVAGEPLRESRWELLARARYQCGRQADALAAIDEARDVLARELGLDVGPALETLQERILRHDGALTVSDRHESARRADAVAPPTEAAAARAAAGTARGGGPRARGGALLERDAELAALHRELSAAEQVGGRIVLVRGEAGIGKSALIRRFLADVAEEVTTHLGVCDDLDTPQPWAPLWDVARDRPELAAALVDGDRRGVMDAAADILSPLGGAALVVVEDVQWADEATLDVIMHVGRRIDRAAGLLLLTFRDEAVDDEHPLRRILGSLPASTVTRIRLAPLSQQAVTTMVADSSHDPAALTALTGGNPLFVSELLATEEELPRSVRDAVLARLTRLAPRARQLVELVSIIPGRARWTTIEGVLGTDRLGTRQAVRHGLLDVHDDGVTFHHELQRRSVEASLSPRDRRRLHAQVLAALDPTSDPARLAHHARHAGDTQALLVHGASAGRRALSAHSHTEAADHFRSVSEHVDALPADEAADIVESWARATFHVDPGAAVDIVLRAATLRRSAGEHVALSRTLAFGAFVLVLGGRGDLAASWAAEAVELVERDGPSADLAYALTEQARVLNSAVDPTDADVAARAVAVAEEIGDEKQALGALNLIGGHLAYRGDPESRALLEDVRSRARQGGHAYEEADALLALVVAALQLYDDVETAVAGLHRARALAAENEWLDLLVFLDALEAIAQAHAGDWDVAEEAAATVLATISPLDAELLARAALAIVATRCGRADADILVRRAWDCASGLGASWMMDAAAALVAEHRWTTGTDDAWRGVPDEVQASRDGAALTGDQERLVFWLALTEPSSAPPDGLDRGYAAILAGEAREAAAIWHERGRPYEESIALLHGSPDDGARAVRMLEDLGADGTAARARALLRDRGVIVPRGRSRAARDHAAGLTERQAEILRLLADGCSNPEIADVLFISRRTVENHVAEVLRKLGADDRDAAVAAAHERGLLHDG